MLVCIEASLQPQAQVWASSLQLTLLTRPPVQGIYLDYSAAGLGLADACQPRVKPVRVDFLTGSRAHRRVYGGGRGQALAKACGLKAGSTPRILDATAGLAADAFVLASLGCPVLAVERHPWVAALVEEGLQRARLGAAAALNTASDEVVSILSHLQLLRGDARTDLRVLTDQAGFAPQVVYLDPMFPHSDKTAQVKKEMQFFRELVGKDADADQLLEEALQLASHRVVVKRPRKAPPLAGLAPGFVLSGKANRFDIYPLRSLTD